MSNGLPRRHTRDLTPRQETLEASRFPNILGHTSTLNSRSAVKPSENTALFRELYPFGMIRLIRLGWVHFASPIRIFTRDLDIAVSVLINTRPGDDKRIAVLGLEERWPTRLMLVIADATTGSGVTGSETD